MGEVAPEAYSDEESLSIHVVPNDETMSKGSSPLPLVITINGGSLRESDRVNTCSVVSSKTVNDLDGDNEVNPQEAWLPITESRNGNTVSCVFHLLSSGIGLQALLLPVAFASLGWVWGTTTLLLVFSWQLYTIWLLVQLHESTIPGPRHSRYLLLAIASFGPKLGKLLAIFPVMYLSGGTCVILIITGGGTMELFFKMICGGDHDDTSSSSCHINSLTGTEWFLVFTCMAIVLAQRPNLNSISGISLIGGTTAFMYCTLIWVLSVSKDRPHGVSYKSLEVNSGVAKMSDIVSAIGIILLAFRGHNLVLEIQGTLPSSPKKPSRKPMWKGITISYVIVALCLFPAAIAGFWAYGNKVPFRNGGTLIAFTEYHGDTTSKTIKGLIYILVVVNCLSSFQIYAMPVFDNLELRYTSIKKKRCPWWVRTGFRLFFGGLTFFISVAFPFLPSLALLIGGLALPLTFSYPCFMWISIRKPNYGSILWCLNIGLGCLGIILSALLVVAAVWNFATKGLNANFFRP